MGCITIRKQNEEKSFFDRSLYNNRADAFFFQRVGFFYNIEIRKKNSNS